MIRTCIKLLLSFGAISAHAQVYTDEVQVISGLGGKVGIGTPSPSAKFEVNGDVKITGWLTTADVSMGTLGVNTTGERSVIVNCDDCDSWLTFHDAMSEWYSVGMDYSDGRKFKINQGGNLGDSEGLTMTASGNIGIGYSSPSQKLSVNGNASKATAGDWLANSDARLKTNISPLHSQKTLQKMLQLQGITYEWSDDKTGLDRPTGIQYGFTAQNIQEVFPSLVVEDDKGYLQSSYSTYDAMLVESIRALNEKIERLERENGELRTELSSLRLADDDLRASIGAILERLEASNLTLSIKPEKE